MARASSWWLKLLLRFIGLALGIGVAIQFVRPSLPNPPVTADLDAPPEVKAIFRTSCYNCHSNETKLSWFDRPAPAYWLVASDVKKARARMNFSDFGAMPAAQQKGLLFESLSQIEVGAMPLPQYVSLHPEAKVTPEQTAVLKNYLKSITPPRVATESEIATADAQYSEWIAAHSATLQAADEPNGFAFLPDYKNWKAISSTDRSDNATLRQILGNDIAIRAIAEHRIDPWPDGAAFAKVAWLQQRDENGSIRNGAFYQVEFMLRDSKKYASTLGWGWGRWRGADLKPYGKDANLADECVGCHSPLKGTNYVFTEPLRGQR
jgi:mono/diheme cytochrome c family protein